MITKVAVLTIIIGAQQLGGFMARDDKSKQLDTKALVAMLIIAVLIGWFSGFALGWVLGNDEANSSSLQIDI